MKCKAHVAPGYQGAAKVSEEVRFYDADGVLQKTINEDDEKNWGQYKEGEEYDITPDPKPAPKPE